MALRQQIQALETRLTKLLHLDVRFYGKSFFLMSLGQASGIVRGVATTFLMARWLPRNTMGEFRYVLAVFGIAGMFSLSGLFSSVIRGVAKGDTVIARVALKRIIAFSPLGSLLLIGAGIERYYVAHETTVAIALGIAALIFPLYSVSGLYGPILTGKEEIKRLVTRAILNNLTFALCFFLVIWRTKELLPVVLAYFVFDVIFRGILTIIEFKRMPSKGDATEHLALGTHLTAIGVFQTLASQLDSILLQRFAGYGMLANYSIASLIPEQMKDFVNAMSGIVLRRFSQRENTSKTLRETRRHFMTVVGFSVIFILGYAVVVPFVLPWLFPQYRNEVLPSVVYAIGLVGLGSIVGLNYFQAHNQIRRLWVFYIVNTILQIGSNLALIPFFGAWGAVFSKTGTRLLSVGFSFPTSAREETKEKIPETPRLD